MPSLPSRTHPLRPLRSLAATCALALLLSGCQSAGTDGLSSSNAPAEISG